MKRLHRGLAIILALAFMMSVPIYSMASETDMGGLTLKELNDWVAQILSQARAAEPLVSGAQAVWTEDGYEVVYDFATLYLDTPVLTDLSVLNAVTVTEYGVGCPRGIGISDTQQMLLSAYANENLALLGSPDFAVLYLSDSLPEEVLLSRAQRDGQQLQTVQYTVHERLSVNEDMYTDCGLLYSINNGYITAVRAYGLSVSITQAEAAQRVAEAAEVLKDQSYFAYPQSSVGTDLDPFEREDLLFSGLDFLGLSPETAIEALGAYETESWLQDDNGEWLRILQWPAAEITFVYSKDKTFRRVDTLAVSRRGLEGPRGVQVGDTLSSVLMRFRHSEGEFEGSATEVLYGDGQTPPYGLAEYDAATSTLRYAFSVEGGGDVKTVTLHMIFADTMLSEMFLYSW